MASKQPKILTESQFAALTKLLQETADLEREKKVLEAKIDANRAAWLQFEEAAQITTDSDRVAAPGVTFKTTTSVSYDAYAAYEWALKDENFTLAGQLLKVRPEAMPSVIALALNDPKFRTWFELNPSGFERAAREQALMNMPVTGIQTKQVVAITGGALKTNPDELRALYVIVPDESEEPTTEPRPFEEIKEHPF